MKKIILSAFAVCAFALSNAQDSKLSFGIKAGVNLSSISGMKGDDGSDAKGRTGFYVGGLANYSISDKFSIQPEVLYSMEGADKRALDYIRIPVMAKYEVVENFSILAGPSFAFRMAAENAELEKATKSSDFGLGIGAAYAFGNIFVDARYNMGLSDIKDASEGDTLKNNNIQLGIGYKF